MDLAQGLGLGVIGASKAVLEDIVKKYYKMNGDASLKKSEQVGFIIQSAFATTLQ